jgi:hypothetical protein
MKALLLQGHRPPLLIRAAETNGRAESPIQG